MSDSSIQRKRKRWTRINLGISLGAVIFWIWLMWYAHSQGKTGWSVYGVVPFMGIAGFNAWNAYRRLRRMSRDANPPA